MPVEPAPAQRRGIGRARAPGPDPLSATCSPGGLVPHEPERVAAEPAAVGHHDGEDGVGRDRGVDRGPAGGRIARPAWVARWCGATTAPRAPRSQPGGDERRTSRGLERHGQAPGPGAEQVLVPAQVAERQQGDAEDHEREEEDPVEAAPLRRDPAGDRADDLAQPEEHGVQAHDRAPVVRVRLGHVGEEADRRGRRAASTNRPPRRDRHEHEQQGDDVGAEVVDPERRDEHHGAARDPVQDDRRAPHVLELAAPVEQAGEEQQPADREANGHLPRLEAAHQRLVGELGAGSRTSWNSVWLVNSPSVALMAIQVGARSQTWLPRGSGRTGAAPPRVVRAPGTVRARRARGPRSDRSGTRRGRRARSRGTPSGPAPGTAAADDEPDSSRRASLPRTGRPPCPAAARRRRSRTR